MLYFQIILKFSRTNADVQEAQQTPKIRILVGINVDKLTYQANQQGLLFNPNAEQSQEEFFNIIKRNIQSEISPFSNGKKLVVEKVKVSRLDKKG